MHHPNRALRRHRQLMRRRRVVRRWHARWPDETPSFYTAVEILRIFEHEPHPLHPGWERNWDELSRMRRYLAEIRAIPGELREAFALEGE